MRQSTSVNPREQWEEVEVPELRIVDDTLWQRVKARQRMVRTEMGKDATSAGALNRAHRRKYLLSGLLTCACCGGGYTVMAQDRYGCATRRGKGTCDNARTIDRQRIEARVLGALKDRLLTPDLVDEFVRTFEAELAAYQKDKMGLQARLQRELTDTERRLKGLLSAIENGAWNDSVRERLSEVEARKADVTERLTAALKPPPAPRLTAAAAEIYRPKVGDLEASLNDAEIKTEAAEALRRLIAKVVLSPDATAPDGMRAELHGELASILQAGLRAGPCGEGSSPQRRERCFGNGCSWGPSVGGCGDTQPALLASPTDQKIPTLGRPNSRLRAGCASAS